MKRAFCDECGTEADPPASATISRRRRMGALEGFPTLPFYLIAGAATRGATADFEFCSERCRANFAVKGNFKRRSTRKRKAK